jgi:S-disulfanyl-L-cysteine oxidoreductase SoxD
VSNFSDVVDGARSRRREPVPARYATTVFDYIRRAMPYNAPRSLAENEDAMDARTLPQVKMPNRDNWIMPYPDRI